MDRWLGDAGRGTTAGSRRGALLLPDICTWEVGVGRCCGVKDDGGDHASLPLRFEQRLELQAGTLGVMPGTAYSDEGRVPVPLVRIERLRRPRVATRPVRVEYLAGGGQKGFVRGWCYGGASAAWMARERGGRLVLGHGTSIHSAVQVSVTASPWSARRTRCVRRAVASSAASGRWAVRTWRITAVCGYRRDPTPGPRPTETSRST